MSRTPPAAHLGEEAEVRREIARLAAEMGSHAPRLAQEVHDFLAGRIDEIGGEASLIDLLHASVEGNVETIIHALRHRISLDNLEPPTAAFEYARRLAQRGTSVTALIRAYRLGQQQLLHSAYALVTHDPHLPAHLVSAVYQQLVQEVSEYIDWISERVAEVYEQERESWLANRTNARESQVRRILDGETPDHAEAERILGYPLTGTHVGVIAWLTGTDPSPSDQLSRFTGAIRGLASGMGRGLATLVSGRDQATAWGWIRVPESWEHTTGLEERIRAHPSVRLAIGSPHAGVAGFRLTHQEALRVQRVCTIGASTNPLASHDDPGMAVTALLSHDLEAARSWVRSVLGGLAEGTEARSRQRETLREFFRHDLSYTATAAAMTMHKNSIRYRVETAEAALGTTLAGRRLDVEAALHAHRLLFDPRQQAHHGAAAQDAGGPHGED
ncbi:MULTISPECIES: PucR family transcriptional regulator [Brevibacterium]|uniref:PucR family transcriptional regulator n=1 Tax=Brevibacterium TaxID=1696 RepID=UPI0025BE3C28|nr:helix-turn-helix domain-containing protein [Brevibacterium sp.]